MNDGHFAAATKTASTYAERINHDIEEHAADSLSVYGALVLRGAILLIDTSRALTQWGKARDRRRVLYVIVCAAGPAGGVGELVTLAQHRGWDVQIIATPAALDFIDAAALEAQTGRPNHHSSRSRVRGSAVENRRQHRNQEAAKHLENDMQANVSTSLTRRLASTMQWASGDRAPGCHESRIVGHAHPAIRCYLDPHSSLHQGQ
jgi:hypothetical protein